MSQSLSAPVQATSGQPSPMLIIGAAYSGKSELAHEACLPDISTVVIGTADLSEAFLEARVRELRRQRPDHWVHVEGRNDLGVQIRELSHQYEQILLDSINQWIANLVLRQLQKYSPEQLGPYVESLIDELLREIEALPANCRLILVSSEVGAGISPPRPVARLFRQLVGRCNTRIAASCPTVLSLTAGIPQLVKSA